MNRMVSLSSLRHHGGVTRNVLSGEKLSNGTARLARPVRTARNVSPKAIFKNPFGGSPRNSTRKQAASAKKELFELLEGSERGLKNSDNRPEVEAIVDRLKELQGDTPTTGGQQTHAHVRRVHAGHYRHTNYRISQCFRLLDALRNEADCVC
eukprot:1183953-Prorocentrum_minimum.AAC.7